MLVGRQTPRSPESSQLWPSAGAHLWRSAGANEPVVGLEIGDGARLVDDFLQLVELHYRDGWPITQYAATLGAAVDKLHAHCKRRKNRNPQAIVHDRLIGEACARLTRLDLSVEEIGYGLGFKDPGYFNRFFRKHTGSSPGVFRRRARLEEAQLRPSYATWP